MTAYLLMLGLLLVLLALIWRAGQRAAIRRAHDDSLPAALRGATLEYAERTFRTTVPVALVARVDRLYRLGHKRILLEFKTRACIVVHQSDVIELSAQKVAVEGATGLAVSEIAFVLIAVPGQSAPRAIEVRLMSSDEVAALARRRDRLLQGKTTPCRTTQHGLCKACAFQSRCWNGEGR